MSVPPKMKALVVSALGPDHEGCATQEVDTPRPAAGEVLVRIRAASVAYPDLLMMRGDYQHRPDLPFIPGSDIAGEVACVGEGVTDFRPGDAVVATRLAGGFAQYGTYAAETLRRMPEHMSFAEGAATGAAYLTAYVALVHRAGLAAGEWVLVHGAAGGVGLAAVDLAKVLGARVIAASASVEKLDIVARKYEPDHVVNIQGGFRDTVKKLTGGHGADVIYDPVGGDVFDESVRCIAFGGRLLVVGFASGRIPTLSVNMPLIKGFSVVGVRAGEFGRRSPDKGRANFDAVWRLAAEGRIRPHVHAIESLERWRDAFAAMADRRLIGRVIIDPAQ